MEQWKSLLFCWIKVWCIMLVQEQSEAARILCVSIEAPSHIGQVTGAAQKLRDYGHELFLVLSNIYPNKRHFEERGFNVLTYDVPNGTVSFDSGHYYKFSPVVSDNKNSTHQMMYKYCTYMMADKMLLSTIKELDFDLVIVDGFIHCLCNLILPEYLGIPFIAVCTTFHPLHARIPALPSFVPSSRSHLSDKMNVIEKLMNIVHTLIQLNPVFKEAHDVSLLRQYNMTGSWNDILNKASLFIATRNYILEWPFPQSPHYITVPGLSAITTAPLTSAFSQLMDNPPGIIVMSFGSVVSTLNDNIIQKFMSAFSRLNETIIWKLKIQPDQQVEFSSNVHIFPWLPQNSLLAHPNTRLFITHCGNGGQHEAAYHGVPMLGVPLFAEQSHNAFRMVHHGIGLQMDLAALTADDIYKNIMTLLTDHQYRDTSRKMSEILKDRPMSGQEEAAYWINHVLQFGGEHLRPSTMDMSVWEFWMIDMLLFVLVIFSTTAALVYASVKSVTMALSIIIKNRIKQE